MWALKVSGGSILPLTKEEGFIAVTTFHSLGLFRTVALVENAATAAADKRTNFGSGSQSFANYWTNHFLGCSGVNYFVHRHWRNIVLHTSQAVVASAAGSLRPLVAELAAIQLSVMSHTRGTLCLTCWYR